MTKLSLRGLSTVIVLLALVCFHQDAKADFDPTDPFASVTISPTPGAIDDITKLQNITISIPTGGESQGDAYITRFNSPTSLNKIIIRKVEGDSYTNVGNSRYNAPVAVDTKNRSAWTAEYGVNLADLNLTAGTYQIYIANAGTFAIYGGEVTTNVSNPANMVFEYIYAPESGSVTASVNHTNGSIIDIADFTGLSVSFPDATGVTLADGISAADAEVSIAGVSVTPQLGDDLLTFTAPASVSSNGIWEVSIPAGFYQVTTASGVIAPSPAINTYFYVGEPVYTTTPAQGATVTFDNFATYSITFGDEWTADYGDRSLREQSYLQIGERKLMGLQDVFLTSMFVWSPTLDGIDIVSPTRSIIYMPEGTYSLTKDGKKFQSPEVMADFTLDPPTIKREVDFRVVSPQWYSYVEVPLTRFEIQFYCKESKIISATPLNLTSETFTVTCGDKTLRYGEDFTLEPGNDLTFVMNTPFDEIGDNMQAQVKLNIEAGAYTLEFEDGYTMPNPKSNPNSGTIYFYLYAKGLNFIDPNDPWSTLAADPKPGHIENASDLNRVTVSVPGPTLQEISPNLGGNGKQGVWLQKKDTQNQWTNIKNPTSFLMHTMGSMSFDFGKDSDPLVLEDGTYRVYFEKDVLKVADPKGFSVGEGGFVYVLGTPDYITWDAKPAANTYINKDNFSGTVTFSIPEAAEIQQVMDISALTCTLDGQPVTPVIDAGNPLKFSLPEGMSTAGKWVIDIPAAFYSVTKFNGQKIYSPSMHTDFMVMIDPLSVLTVSPCGVINDIAELQNVTFSLPGEGKAADPADIYIKSIRTTKVTAARLRKVNEDGSTTVVLDAEGNEAYYNDYSFTDKNTQTECTISYSTDIADLNLEYGKYQLYFPKSNGISIYQRDKSTVYCASDYTVDFVYEAPKPEPEKIAATSTTPAADSVVDGLEQFSIEFADAKQIAWMNDDEQPTITLSYGETTLSYPEDFTAGETPNIMVLNEKLTPESPVTVTVKFAEGIYALTMEDGTIATNEPIEFSFTVDYQAPVPEPEKIAATSTTPASDSVVDGLEQFSVEFADAKQIEWMNDDEQPTITLSYGETTLSYPENFTAGETPNIMVLNEKLTPESPITVTVKFAEGIYALTMVDGTIATNEPVEFSFTVDKDSSIAALLGNETDNNVYTIDGILVLKNADKSAIATLPRGLYIIAGRVVYKK